MFIRHLWRHLTNLKQNKFYSLLGLAEKAGKVSSGEFAVEKSVKEGKAALVIVGADASDNTRKHFEDMCNYRDIPILVFGTKEELGHAIGKETRATIAVSDNGFAAALKKLMEEV